MQASLISMGSSLPWPFPLATHAFGRFWTSREEFQKTRFDLGQPTHPLSDAHAPRQIIYLHDRAWWAQLDSRPIQPVTTVRLSPDTPWGVTQNFVSKNQVLLGLCSFPPPIAAPTDRSVPEQPCATLVRLAVGRGRYCVNVPSFPLMQGLVVYGHRI